MSGPGPCRPSGSFSLSSPGPATASLSDQGRRGSPADPWHQRAQEGQLSLEPLVSRGCVSLLPQPAGGPPGFPVLPMPGSLASLLGHNQHHQHPSSDFFCCLTWPLVACPLRGAAWSGGGTACLFTGVGARQLGGAGAGVQEQTRAIGRGGDVLVGLRVRGQRLLVVCLCAST